MRAACTQSSHSTTAVLLVGLLLAGALFSAPVDAAPKPRSPGPLPSRSFLGLLEAMRRPERAQAMLEQSVKVTVSRGGSAAGSVGAAGGVKVNDRRYIVFLDPLPEATLHAWLDAMETPAAVRAWILQQRRDQRRVFVAAEDDVEGKRPPIFRVYAEDASPRTNPPIPIPGQDGATAPAKIVGAKWTPSRRERPPAVAVDVYKEVSLTRTEAALAALESLFTATLGPEFGGPLAHEFTALLKRMAWDSPSGSEPRLVLAKHRFPVADPPSGEPLQLDFAFPYAVAPVKHVRLHLIRIAAWFEAWARGLRAAVVPSLFRSPADVEGEDAKDDALVHSMIRRLQVPQSVAWIESHARDVLTHIQVGVDDQGRPSFTTYLRGPLVTLRLLGWLEEVSTVPTGPRSRMEL